MTNRTTALSVLLATAAILAPVASADYAVLRSGARLHVTGYQLDGERVRLSVSGGTVEIAASELIDVEPEDQFPAPPSANADFGARYANLIHASAQKHGVDANLIAHVIAAESNFDPKAVSRKRALGLMQLLPETAARYAVSNIFDPAQNISLLEGPARAIPRESAVRPGGVQRRARNGGPLRRRPALPRNAELRAIHHRQTCGGRGYVLTQLTVRSTSAGNLGIAANGTTGQVGSHFSVVAL